jgi:hypothetical protein
MRQTAREAERLDVLLRRLGVTPVPQRQCAVDEQVTRLGRHLHQLRHGELPKGGPGGPQLRQIPLQDPPVHLGDQRQGLPCAVVLDLDMLEGCIGTAQTQRGEMGNRVRHDERKWYVCV